MNNIQNQIEQLKKLVSYHNDLYFNEQSPEISDEEYDQLYSTLIKLEQENPQFKVDGSLTDLVGGSVDNTFNKITHSKPMLSLGKCMDEESLTAWLNNIYQQYKLLQLIMEVKLDGLAISLIYDNGKLIHAVTRGDGIEGEDITESIKLIPSIPKNIKFKNELEIRGEMILNKSSLEKINVISTRQYKNVRNAVSGIVRTKTPNKDILQHLTFCSYMVLGSNNESYFDDANFVLGLGFKFTSSTILQSLIINSQDDKISDYLKHMEQKREELDFDIDGIVIKVIDYNIQKELGEKRNIPNWATAFKFDSQKGISQCIDVEHLLGNKGNITPRASINPVKIGGVTISNVTLHNYDEIKKLGLKIGDFVLVERRGDVIPKITKVFPEMRTGNELDINVPSVCPNCNQTLNYNGVFIRCDNNHCSSQIVSKIENFAIALNIDEIGRKIIEKMVDSNLIEDCADLYYLNVIDLENLERMGKKSANNVITNINKSLNAPLEKVLAGLTIKNASFSTGKTLSGFYKTLENFKTAKYDEIINLPDIGPIVATNVIEWLSDSNNINILNKLINKNVGMTVVEQIHGSLNNKTFAFTGALSMPRKKVEDLVINNGGIVSSIKKDLQFLIIGNDAVQEKIEKAKKHGAAVITLEDLNAMIN